MTEYELLNPSGNVTALVTKDVSREKYKEISNEIMNNNPNVEQVGFLKKYSDTVFRLEMAGLEFCGNASRAFACFLVKEKYVSSNKFEISVSGYDDLIECNVEKKENEFFSTIDLKLKKPISDFIEKKILDGQEVYMVKLPGISHVFLDIKKFKFDKDSCKKEAKEILSKLNLLDIAAVGVIWYENKQIHPVVYVKDIDSLFYENSCGSGSMAFGIYQAYLKNSDGLFDYNVVQKNKEVVGVKVDLNKKIINSAQICGFTKFTL